MTLSAMHAFLRITEAPTAIVAPFMIWAFCNDLLIFAALCKYVFS